MSSSPTPSNNDHQPKSKYAYVTLVMHDESYAIGALVLAYSLKHLCHTKHDLLVMITPDISPRIRQALATLFDHVMEVPVIEKRTAQKLGQRLQHYYASWINQCFTKFHVLRLTQYEKVLFLDADMVAWKCPDDLFVQVSAPAGVCSLVDLDHDAYHGKLLPEPLVRESMLTQYGMRGFLYLLRPSDADFEQIRKKLDSVDVVGDLNHFIGPDERILTEFYMDRWTHIHQTYGCVAWKAVEEGFTPAISHFVTEKPWAPSKEWQEHESWDKVAIAMFKHFPSLSFLLANNDAVIGRFAKAGYELVVGTEELDETEEAIRKDLIPYVSSDETRQIQLPFADFEKLKEKYGQSSVVKVLSQLISNGTIGFPFKKYAMTDEHITTMFQKLVNHKPVTDNAPFTVPSLKFISKEHLFPLSFREPHQYLTHVSPDEDYKSMDAISDYFQERCRLNAQRIDTSVTSMQFWSSRKGNTQVLNHVIEKKKDINTDELRDALYFEHKECTQFKPSLAKFVYETLGGTRILDFSAGWGDRLIAAIAKDVDLYYATDPNTSLQEGHSAIINRLAPEEKRHKFHVQYEPFQTANIPSDLKFNLVFTSPPFFNLERYTVEHEGQSIDDFPQLNEWLVRFLFTSLQKCWNYLEENGHLAIHITDTYQTKICETMNIFIQTYLPGAHYVGVLASRGMADKARPIWVWQKRGDLSQTLDAKKQITHAQRVLSKYYQEVEALIQRYSPLYIPTRPAQQIKLSRAVYDNMIHSYFTLYQNLNVTSCYKVNSTRAIQSFQSIVTETNNDFKNLVLDVHLSDIDRDRQSSAQYCQDIEFCVRQLMMPQFINREQTDLKRFAIVIPDYIATSTEAGIMLHSTLESIGLKKSGNMGMHMLLSEYNAGNDAEDPAITIELVTEKAGLLDFCDVNKKAYNGIMSKEEEDLFTNLKETDLVRRWIAYKQDGDQRTPVGCASVCYNLDTNSCHIMDISVLPDQRCLGLGTRLTRTTISDAIDRGIAYCTLGSTWKALNMYKRIGFQEIEEMRYYRYLGTARTHQQPPPQRRDDVYRRDSDHRPRGDQRSSYRSGEHHHQRGGGGSEHYQQHQHARDTSREYQRDQRDYHRSGGDNRKRSSYEERDDRDYNKRRRY